MIDEHLCPEHSGCIAKICFLKNENAEQWKSIKHNAERINSMTDKLNYILGGIVIAVVLLLINIIINFNKVPIT
jgi:hypothetical protein